MFKKNIKRINRIKHYLRSKNHKNIINDDKHFELAELIKILNKVKYKKYSDEEIKSIEFLKQNALKVRESEDNISYKPFSNEVRKVKEVYSKASSPEEWCELYYILTKEREAINILEIGTNLGVSGQYFLKGLENIEKQQQRTFTSLEGVHDFCQIANKLFDSAVNKSNVTYNIVEGNFADTLDETLEKNILYDIVFIDGNHSYAATKEYFEKFIPFYNKKCIIIFDDINWSKDMRSIWKRIVKDKNVKYSVDLYKLGIIIFEKSADYKKDISYFFKL